MATHHRHRFPRTIARFRQLEGGQYGTLDLVAITDDVLELQLGADFVQFTRAQAEDLRDAVQTFVELEEGEGRGPTPQETMAVEREVLVEEVEERELDIEARANAQPANGQQPGRRKHHHRHP